MPDLPVATTGAKPMVECATCGRGVSERLGPVGPNLLLAGREALRSLDSLEELTIDLIRDLADKARVLLLRDLPAGDEGEPE